MESLFKRYFWLLNVGVLVLGGFLASRAISAFVQFEVLKVPMVEAAGAGDGLEMDEIEGFRREALNRSVDLERRKELATVAREEGGPATPEEKPEEPAEEPETPENPEPEAAPGDDISMDVMGIVNANDPDLSMAMATVDGTVMWVKRGTEVKPGFKVTGIDKEYVVINERIYKSLWAEPEPPAEPAGNPLLAGAGGPPGARPPVERKPNVRTSTHNSTPTTAQSDNRMAEGIKQTGAWEYNIDRSMLDEKLNNLEELGKGARVIPNYDRDSGSYKGFKLIGVRPDSLYRAIGVRSGDIIMRVNGEELTNPAKALELFTQLQTSSNISLDISRRGQTHTLTYKIE